MAFYFGHLRSPQLFLQVVNTDYKTVEEIAEEIVVKLTRDAD